jgi:hypothetical protein
VLNQVTVIFRQALRTKDVAVPRRLFVIPFPMHNFWPLDTDWIHTTWFICRQYGSSKLTELDQEILGMFQVRTSVRTWKVFVAFLSPSRKITELCLKLINPLFPSSTIHNLLSSYHST